MNAGELIEALSKVPPETFVSIFNDDYGQHMHIDDVRTVDPLKFDRLCLQLPENHNYFVVIE